MIVLFKPTRAKLLHLVIATTFLLGYAQSARARILTADPNASPGSNNYYRTLVGQLQPGDTLKLPAGIYRERLNLNNLQGSAEAWITITGPESGPPAIITTDSPCCNNVQLGYSWYVAVKNLTIDSNSDGVGASIDGINAKGGRTHHILIENCILLGLSYHQGTVGISTKSTAWNWTIRKNQILRAGTGLYLGNSDGSAPFIAGIVEGNFVVDTIGYNMQVKFQNPYNLSSGMPEGPNKTIIRNNVFVKRIPQTDLSPRENGSSRVSGARPNLLVGGFPNTGAGSDDLYEIYGNFFYQNPDESLLQASGRVAIHDNIFVDASDTSIQLQHHDLPLKLAHIYNNTIYGGRRGIRFSSSAGEGDAVVGNLVFASSPIGGSLTHQGDNIVDIIANAEEYVTYPSTILGEMDFYPLPGKCQGSSLDLSLFFNNIDYNLDFNGKSKGDLYFRGAYAGEGANPGWQLTDGLKSGGPSSKTPPAPPENLRIR